MLFQFTQLVAEKSIGNKEIELNWRTIAPTFPQTVVSKLLLHDSGIVITLSGDCEQSSSNKTVISFSNQISVVIIVTSLFYSIAHPI